MSDESRPQEMPTTPGDAPGPGGASPPSTDEKPAEAASPPSGTAPAQAGASSSETSPDGPPGGVERRKTPDRRGAAERRTSTRRRSAKAESVLPPGKETPTPDDVRKALEAALFEVKRVVVGQDAMLERLLVALLADGHVLLEGVPGLAKTLTVKTVADVMGGTFKRVQFTPDLVPSDLVGTRIYRPDSGKFDTELGPVFGNLLLADEINRAPAKVQSALLEVMQEKQATIGGKTHALPNPFLVLATQNPIESEGTYPLPEAQIDRFLFKIVVGYPSTGEEAAIVERSLDDAAEPKVRLPVKDLARCRETVHAVHVDRSVVSYAVALADATRHPRERGLGDLAPFIEFGASPRGPIGLVHAARALAVLRGRGHAETHDVRDVARDVLRHRLVLSYDALAENVTADDILDQVLAAVAMPRPDLRRPEESRR